MALIKHIAIKNVSYSDALAYLKFEHDEFTNKPILDENGEMIRRQFVMLEGINCTPETYGSECTRLNRQYGKNNSREEIKAHHYIISFDPRDKEDNGLTPQRAQELGMEFARRHFPGHQIIVCTHTDGHNKAGNIHVHIVFNSLRKLDVEREPFMERPADALAGFKHHVSKNFLEFLKQETMEMCQRESFYQVDLLSPAKVRITDREYRAQRRGQAALDVENQKKIAAGITPTATKYETQLGILRQAISTTLADSFSMEEFQRKLFENYGISVHESRGRLSYQIPDRSKAISARKLGTDFDKGFMESYFRNAQRKLAEQQRRSEKSNPSRSGRPHGKPNTSIRLIVDLQNCAKAQQNKYYAQKLKISNLQQMSKTIAFLQENGIGTREELDALLSSTQADQQSKHDALLATEKRLKTVNLLIRNTGQYLANKKVYGEYMKAKNKKQFRQEHESEILLYEAARKALNELSGGEKIPTLKQLRAEKEELTAKKNEQYESYSFARAKYRELQTIQANVQSILRDTPEAMREHDQELS